MQTLHLVSLLLIAAAWLVAWRSGCRLARSCGVDDRPSILALGSTLPAAGLIFCVHLIALAALFSGAGLVTPEPVAALFALLAWLGHRQTSKHRSVKTSRRRDVETRRPMPQSRYVFFRRFAVSACRPPQAFRRFLSVFRRLPALYCLPVIVVAGMYALFLLDALTRYPTGYDALHYHLPATVGWMQKGSIDLIYGLMEQSFPENGMMVPLLLSFARLESLIIIAHLPKAILLAAVIYGLSRRLGVSARGALLAACVASSIPIIVFQSFTNYIDLYAASSWLCALLALTWATRVEHEGQRRCLVLIAGLSAGISLGSKTTYFVLVFLLLVVVGLVCGSKPSARMRYVTSFAAAALVCCGFWLVRGTVQAGNPVYPLAVTIGDQELLPGFSADEIYPKRSFATRVQRWWDYPWREYKINNAGYNYGVNNGLGAAFAAFVPAGFLGVAVGCFRRRQGIAFLTWRRVFVGLALSGGVLLLTIFRETLRFILPLILLMVPVAALLIDRLIARFPKATTLLLTLSLTATACIATLQPAKSLLGRLRDGGWDRAAFYEMPPLVDSLPAGTRILNLVTNEATYPLLGEHLSNVVITSLHWRLLTKGKGISAAALRKHRIDYVCTVEPPPMDWPKDLPLEWASDNSKTRQAPTTTIRTLYRVRPSSG